MDKKIKILLVDDDRDLLQVLQMALEINSAFKVVTAINGQEGCFKFRNEDFDVIITDLKMPKMDGIEFIHAIMKIKEVPIFVISASLEAFKFKLKDFKIMDIKNIHVLHKPFDPDDLVHRVKEIMKNAPAAVPGPAAKEAAPAQVDSNHVRFAAGETVFEERSIPEEVFIVKEGTFVVYKKSSTGENVPVTKISAGEVLGEMAVFTGGLRTSTVIAQTDGVLIKLPLDKVKDTLNGQPAWFRVMMKTISIRLSDTTSALAEARSEINTQNKKVKKEA